MNMTSETRTAIASNVKTLRLAREWSQAQLAAKAGISQTSVSYIERADGKSPTAYQLEAIGAALGVPVWTLLVPDASAGRDTPQQLGALVARYTHITADGRRTVDAIAEAEARYTASLEPDE